MRRNREKCNHTETEVCTCSCHTTGARHCVACCTKCYSCGRQIAVGYHKEIQNKKEMSQNGKGDSQRPRQVSYEQYANNWDKAFGKKRSFRLPARTRRSQRCKSGSTPLRSIRGYSETGSQDLRKV